MFAIVGAILAGVWLVLTVIAVPVPGFLEPLVLLCVCLHLALGPVFPVGMFRRE